MLSALLGLAHRSVPPRLAREHAAWYLEQRSWLFRRILEGGNWTIHDLIDRPDIRDAVKRHWQLSRRMERDREVEAYINYLEYLEAVSRKTLPETPRRQPSVGFFL